MVKSRLVGARENANKYWKEVTTLKQALDEQPSEKSFKRVLKRLNKARKNVEKWRNKALQLDKLPNAADKLPPIEEVELEEYMGPLFSPDEVKTIGQKIEEQQERLKEFVKFEDYQGNRMGTAKLHLLNPYRHHPFPHTHSSCSRPSRNAAHSSRSRTQSL